MSLFSAVLPGDTFGVKLAKIQRDLRAACDNAGIIYNIGGLLQDVFPGDTEGVKLAKIGAWTRELADNIGGGGVPAGPITTSGLTMNTARILGRTTAGSGAVEEISVSANLTLAAGVLGVAAAQTTITDITPPGGTLTVTGATTATGILKTNTFFSLDGVGVLSGTGNGLWALYNLSFGAGSLSALNLTASGSVTIGGGTAIAKVLSATATLNFGSILAAGNEDLTITVTGAAVGDRVVLALPATVLAGAIFNAWVSAANTVTVRCNNAGSIAIDPASATYAAAVIQF